MFSPATEYSNHRESQWTFLRKLFHNFDAGIEKISADIPLVIETEKKKGRLHVKR